jgi:hypothetical protein
MNSYPPELLAQLAPVMFVAGLGQATPPNSGTPATPTTPGARSDPFQTLTARLRDVLLAQRKVAVWQAERSKTFQVILVDKVWVPLPSCLSSCLNRLCFDRTSDFHRVNTSLKTDSLLPIPMCTPRSPRSHRPPRYIRMDSWPRSGSASTRLSYPPSSSYSFAFQNCLLLQFRAHPWMARIPSSSASVPKKSAEGTPNSRRRLQAGRRARLSATRSSPLY